MSKEKTEKKGLSKDIGVNIYPIKDVIRKTDDGKDIPYPVLAYVHVMFDSGFGTMKQRNWRILEGKDNKPFIVQPGKSRKLFDDKGNQVSTQRFKDLLVTDPDGEREFERAVQDKALKAYRS